MIGASEAVVAVVSSVFLGAALLLLAHLLTVAVRRARAGFADDLFDRAVEHGAAIGRDLVGTGPADGDHRSVLDRRCAVLIGLCLIGSAATTLVATFVPLYRAVPRGTPNFTLSQGLHYAAFVWYFEIALSAAISWLAFRRRNRIIASVVVGYCAPAIGGVALNAVFFTLPHSSLGPAYYLLQISDALEVVALVAAMIALVAGRADRARPSVHNVWIAGLAALLLAVSATMNLTRVRGQSLWYFGQFPARMVPAVVVNLVVLALVPLVAITLGAKTASFVALGLAVVTGLSAASAVLDRLYVHAPFELTVGFWLTAFASVALFVLAGSLRPHDRTTPTAPDTDADHAVIDRARSRLSLPSSSSPRRARS